ncbi:MAG: hypothetical protein AAF583_00555 [Pseudomonadota bacterium]
MDVNGLAFRQLHGRSDFGFGAGDPLAQSHRGLAFDQESRHVRLASQRRAPALREDEMFARQQVSRPAPIADPFGGFGWWNRDAKRLEASGFLPGSIGLMLEIDPSAGPSDLMLGTDEVLYVAHQGAVLRHDLRDRWPNEVLQHREFSVDLLAPHVDGGGWAFDRTDRKLMRITGQPQRFAELTEQREDAFALVEPNSDPSRIEVTRHPALDDEFDAVCLTTSKDGQLALLAWVDGEDAAVLLLQDDGWVLWGRLQGLRFPYSLAWIEEDRLAALASDGAKHAKQAFVYNLESMGQDSSADLPQGLIYPLRAPLDAKFCNCSGSVPRYLNGLTGGQPESVKSLRALSGDAFARQGSVLIGPIDGGREGLVWHRFFVEAALAEGTEIELAMLALDHSQQPALPEEDDSQPWAKHKVLPGGVRATSQGWPVASWSGTKSEIPNAQALLQCPSRPDKSGLFECLIQRNDTRVRRVEGRYLWLRLTMTGAGDNSPELAAIRVYGGRRSWRDMYLPDLYGETVGGEAGAAQGPATPPDFMERFLHSYEGVLTEIEGRIAQSWQWTDPATAPDDALPWIGQWVGIEPRHGESPAKLRQRLIAAPHTRGLVGTTGGLLAALELATGGKVYSGGRVVPGRRMPAPGELAIAQLGSGRRRVLMLSPDDGSNCMVLAGGAVTKGEVVAIEGFRLRQTFATILGADLEREDDPLTLGMSSSGNSYVGDTLILGDIAREELLSLFSEEIDPNADARTAVENFYARLAWRVLVLVRGESQASMAMLQDVIREEIPAYIEASLFAVSAPLLVGVSSLLGVDTFMAEPASPKGVRIGQSKVGRGDRLDNTGRLDSRAEGPIIAPPTGRVDGPDEVWIGGGFTLSALASEAASRRNIERFIWTWEKDQ